MKFYVGDTIQYNSSYRGAKRQFLSVDRNVMRRDMIKFKVKSCRVVLIEKKWEIFRNVFLGYEGF